MTRHQGIYGLQMFATAVIILALQQPQSVFGQVSYISYFFVIYLIIISSTRTELFMAEILRFKQSQDKISTHGLNSRFF